MRRIVFAALALLAATAAVAQPAPPKMTWVRYYQVERGREADFMRLAREAFKPVLDGLQQQGKVAGWGVAVPLTETAETWTHVLFIALPDWGGVEALDTTIQKAISTMPPDVAARTQQLGMSIRDGSVQDVILRHVSQSAAPPPTAPSRYIVVETHKIKSGREGEALQLFNEWAAPIFTDLTTKGLVGPWGLSVHGVAGAADWTHMVWYFVNDLTALERIIEANDPRDRKVQGYWVRLRDMSEAGMHRAQILRVVQP